MLPVSRAFPVGVIRTGELNGWESVTLSSGNTEVTILPAKGGDIYALVDTISGVDVLMKSPRGLAGPGASSGSDAEVEPIEFLRNYEGGWQTLFPSAGDECVYGGRQVPFHGEVALLPWRWEPIGGLGGIRLDVRCQTVPLELSRVVTVGDTAGLCVTDSVLNLSDEGCDFVLGHHFVLGAPFLEAGGRLEIDADSVVTSDAYWEDTARILAGQTAKWPSVPGRSGGVIDLRQVEGPEAGSHDDLFATDLRLGTASISNPRLGLTVQLDWDCEVFKWVAIWQAFGGARMGSLAGTYALGVEPWTSRTCLSHAAESGTALRVGAGEIFQTSVTARLVRH